MDLATSDQSDEQPLDGNMTPVVRVGDTVRRTRPEWWQGTHALLRHLEAVGFSGSPRLLSVDDQDREILSFVDGDAGSPALDGIDGDDVLVAVARLIHAYHDAVATFQPTPDAQWPLAIGAPATGPIICHNDIAPWNTIFRHGAPVALIDWDLAAPAPATWDIAYALWRYVPFYLDDRFGPPEARARRAAHFCDAYGLSDRTGLVDLILQRQRSAYHTVEQWGRAGRPGFAQLYEVNLHGGALDDIAYVECHAAVLRNGIERRSFRSA